MSFLSVTLPSAQIRWELNGPAGPHMDTLVASLIGAGVQVEPIVAGTSYRLKGPAELLDILTSEMVGAEGFTLGHELAPLDTIRMASVAAPTHPYRRSVSVHGTGPGPCGFIARAVDRRLTVETVGINRFSVSGRTAELVDWLAAIYVKTTDEVLALFGLTAEIVAAEDSPAPAVSVNLPPVQVSVILPDRKTTSEIARNAAGDIVQVVQLESSVKEPKT